MKYLFKLKKVYTLLLCGVTIMSIQAQGKLFENWSIGANAGLYGLGGQVATSLAPNFKLRAGFDYLSYSYNEDIEFDAPVVNIEGYDEEMSGKLSGAKLKFPNFKVMVDYYPMKNGIFCLTTGFYVGNNKITTDGSIDRYKELVDELAANGQPKPEFKFEDIVINPNDDGSFNARLKMGNNFKPYIGIGLGKNIPSKNRVGFKFELGLVYQGEYKIESDNINDEGINRINDEAADFDLPVSKSLLNWWPMLNFTLSYRIK